MDVCRNHNLAPPSYRHHLEANGTHTCVVRIGGELNRFGDDEESFVNEHDAAEDHANKATNALHCESALNDARSAPHELHARFCPVTNVQHQERPRDAIGSTSSIVRPGSAQAQERTCQEIQICESLKGQSGPRPVEVPRAGHNVLGPRVTTTSSEISELPASRTRAGLARLLRGISEPQQRAGGMLKHSIMSSVMLKLHSYM